MSFDPIKKQKRIKTLSNIQSSPFKEESTGFTCISRNSAKMLRKIFVLGLLVIVATAQVNAEDENQLHKVAPTRSRHRYYDWKQWLSEKDKSSTSDDVKSSNSEKGGMDWKKWLSNSYNQIPSSLQSKYSFSPYNWESFLPFGADGKPQHYDWQQWLSKSSGKSKKGGYDWQKWLSKDLDSDMDEDDYDWEHWLSNSYVPSDVQYYDWKKWVSTSGKGSAKGSGKKWSKSKGAKSSGKGGKYDWKQWVSKSGTSTDSAKPDNSASASEGYNWKKWLSKSADSGSGTGKGNGYDWKKWLSKSAEASGSTETSASVDDSENPTSEQNSNYDWKQWVSKSDNSGYDWKQWVSKSSA